MKLHHARFLANVPNKTERSAIMQWIESDPPCCMLYKDRFCFIEYTQTSPKTHLAIVVDHGKAVLIIHREKSKVIWEEDHGT